MTERTSNSRKLRNISYILYTHWCRYIDIHKAYEKSLFNCKLYDESKDEFHHKNLLQSYYRYLLFSVFNKLYFIL